MLGTAQVVLLKELSLFQGYPYFRGVYNIGDVLISGVSIISEESLFQGCL